MYFVITSGEDGTLVREMDKEQLQNVIRDLQESYAQPVFLDHVPESDKGCWMGVDEGAILIIKGEIIQPKPLKVVTEYEI